ncbi:MAG: right-handed parallel beta-helix repeat-containing protein [Promethearchaeota archaeon]
MKQSFKAAIGFVLLLASFLYVGSCVFASDTSYLPNEGIRKVDSAVLSFLQHSAIEITSNADFAAQGWDGLGTPEYPYQIDGLLITTQVNGACIRIVNTDVNFEITNCILNPPSPSYGAVHFESVTNGVIDNCAIGESALGIWIFQSNLINVTRTSCSSSGISIDTSNYVFVADSAAQNSPGDGISLTQTSSSVVSSNFVIGCVSNGIYAGIFSDDNYFLGNDVRSCTDNQIFLDSTCSNNCVYGNNLWAGGNCARDDGSSNSWDDAINLGNGYSDYSGSGPYTIPGSAGSIDHYPRLASTTQPTSSSSSTTTTTSTTTVTVLENRTFTLDLTQPLPLEIRYVYAALYLSASFVIAALFLAKIWRSKQ